MVGELIANIILAGRFTFFLSPLATSNEPAWMHPSRKPPILAIFDEAKAREFYVDFLGFQIDWEHRFEGTCRCTCKFPAAGLTLHLSEHVGDACPGSTVFVRMTGIDALHAELTRRNTNTFAPAIENRAVECEVYGGDRSVRNRFASTNLAQVYEGPLRSAPTRMRRRPDSARTICSWSNSRSTSAAVSASSSSCTATAGWRREKTPRLTTGAFHGPKSVEAA